MIIDYSTLQKIRAENSDSMIALIKGTFDLLHYDHIKLLQTIKSQNDIVVVQVKSDVDAREKGAGRPIMCETERSAIVDSIRYTDYTIVACEQGNTELIERLSSQSTYSEREIYKLKRDGYVLELLRPNRNYYTTEKTCTQIY